MNVVLRLPFIALVGALALGGCASDSLLLGNNSLNTGSIAEKPKVDPACVALSAEIQTLRTSGVVEKIEKAAVRKYRLNSKDAANADKLTKANAEFQAKCSTLVPDAATAAADAASDAAKAKTVASAATATSTAAKTAAASAAAKVAAAPKSN